MLSDSEEPLPAFESCVRECRRPQGGDNAQLKSAGDPRRLVCAQCGAPRAHLRPSAEPGPSIDLPPEVASDPEKLQTLIQETHSRILELDKRYADPSIVNDPVLKKQLDEEYEALHVKAEALTRRWAQLVDEGKAPDPNADRR